MSEIMTEMGKKERLDKRFKEPLELTPEEIERLKYKLGAYPYTEEDEKLLKKLSEIDKNG